MCFVVPLTPLLFNLFREYESPENYCARVLPPSAPVAVSERRTKGRWEEIRESELRSWGIRGFVFAWRLILEWKKDGVLQAF